MTKQVLYGPWVRAVKNQVARERMTCAVQANRFNNAAVAVSGRSRDLSLFAGRHKLAIDVTAQRSVGGCYENVTLRETLSNQRRRLCV